MNGWIKLHRKLIDKGYYKKSQYVHLWVHLLLKANHKPNEFMWNKELIIIKEGQLLTGRKELSKETGISQTTIERILNLLENEHQIEQQKTTKFRVITIINYKEYQTTDTKTDNKRTTNGQQTDTNKNNKKDNNEKNILEDLWNLYPKKLGKKQAMIHLRSSVKTEQDYEDCKNAIETYISECKKNNTNEQYIKHGSTFFNNWRDYVKEVNPEEKIYKEAQKQISLLKPGEVFKFPELKNRKLLEKIKSQYEIKQHLLNSNK